jgi:hypothetical protein
MFRVASSVQKFYERKDLIPSKFRDDRRFNLPIFVISLNLSSKYRRFIENYMDDGGDNMTTYEYCLKLLLL